MNYLNTTLNKIEHSNKLCSVMGDFNLDLLQMESHNDTDNFLNTPGSSFFFPQILQPTRITDHSATLIDNIVFNSLEYFTISGNIVYDLTDHLPNFLVFNDFASLPNNIKMYKRDYSTFDQNALGPSYMVSGTRDNPSPEATLSSVYMNICDLF